MKNVLKKLAKAKTEMGSVIKGTENGHFKSRYADLNAYLEVVEPALQANGLLLLQPLVSGDSSDKVVTTILDVDSGESVTSEMKLLSSKGTMQDLGSAVTYARRYTLSSLLGLGAEDDDGNAATGLSKVPAPKATSSFRRQDTPVAAPVKAVEASKTVTAPVVKTVKVTKTASALLSAAANAGWE